MDPELRLLCFEYPTEIFSKFPDIFRFFFSAELWDEKDRK